MKTFKQFKEDNQYVSEGVGALIGTGLKLGGKALGAYSAYKAGESLTLGKPKQAAINAIGAIPGGRAFKTIKSLGGAKKLAKVGSFTQSALRHGTDNPFSRGVEKVYTTAGKYAKKVYDKIKK